MLVEEMGFNREAVANRTPELRSLVEPLSLVPEATALRAEYEAAEKSLQVRGLDL